MSSRILAFVAVSLFVSVSPPSPSHAASLHIPAYFYGDRLGSCQMMYHGRLVSLKSASVRLKIKEVIGYDWDADHHARSDSLSVRHERISFPARLLFAASHFAMSRDDPDQIQQAVSYVVGIAQAETILNTMTVREVKNIGSKCYEGSGKTSAKCWAHAPQFAAQFAGNYLVSAVLLKTKMTDEQRAIVDKYAKRLHRRYIKPWYADARKGRGFYQMANGGISELAYAAWSEDKRLASKTFKRMFKDIRNRFYRDGYINNNSFRGVRGFWYHTYGVNSALAVVGLAQAWNVSVPDTVSNRVKNAVELINVGVNDLAKFDSRKFSGYRGNASTNPKDARPHIHQMAIGIDAMARHYVDVTLERDPIYLRKRVKEGPSDFTLGFHPVCMIQQGSTAWNENPMRSRARQRPSTLGPIPGGAVPEMRPSGAREGRSPLARRPSIHRLGRGEAPESTSVRAPARRSSRESEHIRMTTTTHARLQRTAVDAVRSIPGIEAVVLFGSRTRGTARQASDWDIAVLSRAAPEDERAARRLYGQPHRPRLAAPDDVEPPVCRTPPRNAGCGRGSGMGDRGRSRACRRDERFRPARPAASSAGAGVGRGRASDRNLLRRGAEPGPVAAPLPICGGHMPLSVRPALS